MKNKFDGEIQLNDKTGYFEAYLSTIYPQNHASKMLELSNGDILCVWFSGTQEGMSDISIFMARLNKGKTRWTKPMKLTNDINRSEQNPVLFEDENRRIWLFYTAQKYGNQDTAIVRYRISDDDGYTWSSANNFFEEPGTFIRQSVVVLKDGTWVFPIFRCATRTGEKWTGNYDTSAVKVSRDHGENWQEYEVPDSVGLVHMCINILQDGSLVSFFRSRYADFIYRSISTNGYDWSKPQKLELPNNNSSIQSFVLNDGAIAMVFNNINGVQNKDRRESLYDEIEEDKISDDKNNVSSQFIEDKSVKKAVWGVKRAPLTIALSYDNGKTWTHMKNIQIGDGNCISNDSKNKKNRELSYPSIIQSKDGRIHVTFTYFRQAIKYVTFDKNWILEK